MAARSVRLIDRWSLELRLVHWGMAIAMSGLLASGLALQNPELRGIPFLGSKLMREVHLSWAVLLAVLPALAASWDGFQQLRHLCREAWRLRARAARLNVGQKLNVLVVLALAAGLALTGLVLAPLGPSPVPQALRELAYPLHVLLAYAMTAIVAAHVVVATLVPGNRGALRGMVLGSVRLEWARAHHPHWLATVTEFPGDSPPRDK
jgi:formate dehydrogenase subunit gamma